MEEDEDELLFAEHITAFHHALIDACYEDAFACLLRLSNALARIRSKNESNGGEARAEMLEHCTETLATKLIGAIGEINKHRTQLVRQLEKKYQGRSGSKGHVNPRSVQSGSSSVRRKLKTKPRAKTPRMRKGIASSAASSSASSGGFTTPRMASPANSISRNSNHNSIDSNQEDRNQDTKFSVADEVAEQFEALYREDNDRLAHAAALCRLLQSVSILLDKDQQHSATETSVGEQGQTEPSVCEQNTNLKSHFAVGFDLFAELVIKIFSEKCIAAKNELSAHRSLATRTTKLGVIEAAEDDPYLKALSILLENAHEFVEELTMGSLAIGGLSSNRSRADEVKQLETLSVVEDLDVKTSEFAVPVLIAIYKDRKVEKWLQRAEDKERSSSEQPMFLSDSEVTKLSSLLNDLMEVQQYCSKFTQFLSSFYDYYGKAKSNKIADENQKIVSAYVRLEKLWLNHSFYKAIKTAHTQDIDGILVNSLVDNTFYVIRNGFARAVHTGSELAASATANLICHSIQEEYTQKLRRLMSESLQHNSNSTAKNEDDDEEDDDEISKEQANDDIFAAALESDIVGVGRLSTSLLCAINSVELSAKFIRELVEIIRNEFEVQFPSKVVAVEMALQGLEEMRELHESMKSQAIQEVVASCITPTQETAIVSALSQLSYRMNNSTYDSYERDDPFVHKFLSTHVHGNKNLNKCRKQLTPSNYLQVVCEMSKAISDILKREILKKNGFNALGALRLEKDIDLMRNGLVQLTEVIEIGNIDFDGDGATATTEDKIRFFFTNLKHISFLVQQPRDIEAKHIQYPLETTLTDEDVRLVLSKRVD